MEKPRWNLTKEAMSQKESKGYYALPNFTQGDTFDGREIARITQGGEPLTIYKAAMELRKKSDGSLVWRWQTWGEAPNAEITGDNNAMTLHPVHESITAQWPLGLMEYDVEVWFSPDTDKKTIMGGPMKIEKGTTANS
jgi:hypothetical protein